MIKIASSLSIHPKYNAKNVYYMKLSQAEKNKCHPHHKCKYDNNLFIQHLLLLTLLPAFKHVYIISFYMLFLSQVGNLANDGIKLATGTGKCSAEPDDGLEEEAPGGTLR